MNTTDSFFIPCLKYKDMIYIVDTCAKRAGIRVKIYPAMKDGVLGIRVWKLN